MVDQGGQVSRLQLARLVRLLVCVAAVAVGWTVLAGATTARASETAPGRTLGGLTPALSATLKTVQSTVVSTVQSTAAGGGERGPARRRPKASRQSGPPNGQHPAAWAADEASAARPARVA